MHDITKEPDYEIFRETRSLLESLDKTATSDISQARYFVYPLEDRIPLLMNVVLMVHLRHFGNYNRYIEIYEHLSRFAEHTEKDTLVYRLMIEMRDNINRRPDMDGGQKYDLVLAGLAYGLEYINKFLDISLPSLLAEGNLPHLAKTKKIAILLYTDRVNSAITEKLKKHDIDVIYEIVSSNFLAVAKKDVYTALGWATSMALMRAKQFGAAYHTLYPDIVYSNNYFKELERLSAIHEVILAPGMRSSQEKMLKALNFYRKDDTINVPASDLMALHLNNNHASTFGEMVNNSPASYRFPKFHVNIWEAEDYVRIDSPHLDLIWLSANKVRELQPRYYLTIDSELDFIIPKDAPFYIPQLEDDMYRAELSPKSKDMLRDLYTTAEGSAENFWECVKIRDLLKFYAKGMKCKINRDIRPIPKNVIPDAHLKNLRNYLLTTILIKDPYPWSNRSKLN